MDLTSSLGNINEASTPATASTARTDHPRPVATAERIKTIDVIRGVALLGILMMNIPGFGIHGSVFPAIVKGPRNSADFYTLGAIEMFFSGTMRGLFSMLFGAGMILFMLNKKQTLGGVTVAEYYYRRLLWLVLFGVINAYVFLWPGDILFFYGLCGMLLFPFRKLRPQWLILIGFLCIGIGIQKNMKWFNQMADTRAKYLEAVAAKKANKEPTDEQKEAKTAWLEREKWQTPDTARINREIKKMHGGYATIFDFYLPRNSSTETWAMYHGLWDMLCMMFIGMGLFGWGFFSNKLSTSTYLMGLLTGYGVGILLGWIIFFKGQLGFFVNAGAYIDQYRVPHFVMDDFRRLFLCIGHASLILLVFRSRLVPWLMKALASTGQMAFTNYLMQSIICSLFFYGYGLGYYNKLAFHQLYYVVAAIWILQMIFSSIWLSYFRFGPFEWVWRSLTYWEKQPMRITSVEPVAATA